MKKLIVITLLALTQSASALHPLTLHLFPFLAETIEDKWPVPLRYVDTNGCDDGEELVLLVQL